MIVFFQIGLTVVGIIAVVAIVNPWLLVPTMIVAVIFSFMRSFYLKTARNVKRLEGVSKLFINYNIANYKYNYKICIYVMLVFCYLALI